MSFFAKLIEFFTLPKPPEADATQPPPAAANGHYAPLYAAVQNELQRWAKEKIPEHRRLAKNDVLEPHCLEIEPAAPEGRALLDEFFDEFDTAARQELVRSLLGGNAAVKLDCFADIYRKADLPAADYLDPYLQRLNQDAPAPYSVRLLGRWTRAAAQPDPTPQPQAAVHGSPALLRVHDRRGPQPEIRRETYPLLLGRSGAVVADGRLASGSHCTLRYENGQAVLEDHSRNGTWVDGAKLHQQSQPLALGLHRLKLGGVKGGPEECPEIELELLPAVHTPVATPTPVAACPATPVVLEPAALLAVLASEDASGGGLRDVLGLPFRIGRASGNDYATPAANAGVSGLHLTIEAMTEDGAEVVNHAQAKNGTALDGALQGERFFWPFGQTLSLAPKFKNAEPVSITLKRPQ